MEKWMNAAYDGEDEEIWIEERVASLMNEDDFDPSSVAHMSEAISEASEDDQETIRDFIERKEWDKLGAKLFYMSYDYMEKFAQNAAQREVEQGLHL